MQIKRWSKIVVSVLLVSVLAACGEAADENVGVFKGVPDAPVAGTGGGGGNTLVVDSAAGADNKFAQPTLSATTGEIKVTFNNKGVAPHNWTLVKQGEEQATADAAMANAPDYKAPTAIGQTKTINANESDSITVTVTEPGTYSYICTFPGHYATGMVGTLTVAAGGGAPAGGGATGGAGAALTSNTVEGADSKYAEATLTAGAGEVSLTFNNKGVLPHNWTLVKAGEEQAAADAAVANAPDYKAPSAIAQTRTINGGESDTITFSAQPGTYTFICTFPGHYALGMKGTLTIQ